MIDTEPIFREIGLAPAMLSAEDLRFLEGAKQVIDRNFNIVAKKAAPFRTPRFLDYTVGTTLPQVAGRGGTLDAIRVRCGTAPSLGDAVITVTHESPVNGIETYPVTVPQGDTYGYLYPKTLVGAADWFGVATTTANGASGVSAGITINVGE